MKQMKRSWTSQHERMTEQPVPSLVLELGGPAVVSFLISTVYNMADTFFVAQIGTSAVAAVGISFAIMEMISSFGYLFGTGAGTLIGMRLGAKENEEAARVGSTAFAAWLLLGTLIGVTGILFLQPLMRFLGSSDAVLPYAKQYAFWILAAFPIMGGAIVLSSFLRSEGKMKESTLGIGTGGILNIALDPFFIIVLKLGVGGAAIATALSQLISFGILLFFFLSGRTDTKLSPRRITPKPRMLRDIVVTGLPSLSRHGILTLATIALNTCAGMYGGDVMIAALTIVNKVTSFIQGVIKGVFQGAQSIYSYNKGAGRYDRVRQAFRFSLTFNLILIMVIAAGVSFTAGGIIGLFRTGEPEIQRIGTYALIVHSWSLLLMPYNFASSTLLQCVGEPGKATILAALPQGGLYIIFLFVLPRLVGANGVIWAMAAGQAAGMLITLPIMRDFFRRIPA